MYLYKTTTYHDTTNVATVPADNATDNSDFVTNNKASAVKVDEVVVSETTFVTVMTYADFDTLVGDNATWASVKYTVGPKDYTMYLISSSALS